VIIDCFRFFNEFDVLELRLRTLDTVVDRFIICEAPFTFRGEPKPLYFEQQAERFAAWRDRITLIEYPGPPVSNPWITEERQRAYLGTALTDCAPDDLILIGDCDEIPDPQLITQRPSPGRIVAHRMVMMRGYANRAVDGSANVWFGTRAVPAASIEGFGGQTAIRRAPRAVLEIVDGGWHFTSLGGTAVMERKLRSFSHAELDIPYFRDRRRLDVHYDTAGGPDDACIVPVAQLPAAFRDDSRFKSYLWNEADVIDGERGRMLEHIHGCFAYVPDDAARVAVLTTEPGLWHDAANERFGAAWAGVTTDAGALAHLKPDWIVVDGLERMVPATLAGLHATGAHTVVFAANARSLETFQAALDGRPLPPGQALGHTEYAVRIDAAGYALRQLDRVPTRKVPWTVPPTEMETFYQLTLGSFTFAELSLDALHDFESNAFVFTLDPR
jgi:hypothetical protein